MPVDFRPGTEADSETVFHIFLEALQALSRRLGTQAISGGSDPQVIARLWERRQGLFRHLARTASEFWIAEVNGKPMGYARAIRRGEMHELTEFFVRPDVQQAGLGRELLARTYSLHPGELGVIVATQDPSALARYMKAGHVPRFPATYFEREPQRRPLETDLEFRCIKGEPWEMGALAGIDAAVLGHTRMEDLRWLLEDRTGMLCLRAGKPVGYGFYGSTSGPIALLDPHDFSVVLAYIENQAAATGQTVGFEVPLVNIHAVTTLLKRGYRMDGFITQMMSTLPFGHFDRYIYTGPPFFL
ncbi:MAG: GNAT family N-acetyltransferase [Anaerolineales bacterium]